MNHPMTRVVAVILILLIITTGVAGSVYPKLVPSDKKQNKVQGLLGESEVGPERLNILLLGVDARRNELDTKTRTDTVILASIDRVNKKIYMLSIPRDSRVMIPGRGYNRINAANALGGVELAQATVENLLGVPVDYYVMTNFDGFRDVVNTLGGVTLDVERRMRKHTDDMEIRLEKGVQQLDGDRALQYVRFRSDSLGDVGRTQRQLKFLQALAKETLQVGTITKLPRLIPQLNRAVRTNLGISEMLTMVSMAKYFKADNIIAQTLPGRFQNISGASYWGIDEVEAKKVVANLLAGKVTTEVVHLPGQEPAIKIVERPVPKVTAPVEQPAPATDPWPESEETGDQVYDVPDIAGGAPTDPVNPEAEVSPGQSEIGFPDQSTVQQGAYPGAIPDNNIQNSSPSSKDGTQAGTTGNSGSQSPNPGNNTTGNTGTGDVNAGNGVTTEQTGADNPGTTTQTSNPVGSPNQATIQPVPPTPGTEAAPQG